MKKAMYFTKSYKKIFTVSLFVCFTTIFSPNSYSHEDGGEKDIRCSVTYGTEPEMDIWGLNKIEGGETLYTITIQPAISPTFLNNHIDIGVLPKTVCTPVMDSEFCLPWETANVDLAPSIEFIAETKNGIQHTGKYAILNYEDPPKIKPHPYNHPNTWYISKEQYDEAERGLNYCVLIY
tara:strand:- start:7 stop:543 length:537 start_codon:yes stop_codon:yes gene_type:complete